MPPKAPSYIKNLRQESVVQSVINCITDGLRSGELKPGDRLMPEPELAASLGIARSSVREALKLLTYLGVLESKRSEGTFVCSGFKESMIDPMIYGIILHQDSFDDLMELRQMLETGTMRLAILKCTDEELASLAAVLRKMRDIAAGSKNKIDDFFEADNEFHDLIQEMGKNPLTDKINRVVRTLTYAMRYETVKAMIESGQCKELVEAHERLYHILLTKDISHLDEDVRNTYFREVLEQ